MAERLLIQWLESLWFIFQRIWVHVPPPVSSDSLSPVSLVLVDLILFSCLHVHLQTHCIYFAQTRIHSCTFIYINVARHGDTGLQIQHLKCKGRQISMNLRSSLSTQWVPGSVELHSKSPVSINKYLFKFNQTEWKKFKIITAKRKISLEHSSVRRQ